jgi:hypothetical protein
MRSTRTQNLFGTLLSLALVLPTVGCVMDAGDDLADVDAVEELVLEDGTVVEVSPAAACTISAATPYRGTRYKNNVAYDAVIGSASVSCSANTSISVRATLRNETTGRNGYWDNSCYGRVCSVEVWLSYTSGRWYTEGYSAQASPSTSTSGWRDL